MVKDKLKRLEKRLPQETDIRVFLIDEAEGTFVYQGMEYPLERYNEFTTEGDHVRVINAEFV